jgi:type VI secretion system secreted protein VgrG
MTSSNLGHTNAQVTSTKTGIKKVGAVSLAGSIIFGLMAFSGISPASAAEPTVPLGTAEGYSVLAGSTVTNTGPSVLAQSLGLTPGSAVTGFPPGIINGSMEIANGPALQAQTDLTTAYNSAAGRSVTATVGADLVGTTLPGGVYKSATGPLSLTGTLTLDGQNDPNSVFIFQSDSTLITGSASRINLINGAQACNVFWQVGSSATLGTGSSFVGTVMALTSVTAQTAATIEGRVMARNGAVTLDNNVITAPGCDMTVPTATPSPSATTPVVIPTVTTPVGVPTVTVPADTPTSTSTNSVTPPTDTATMTATGTSTTNAPRGGPTTPGMTTTETETTVPVTPEDTSTPLANTGANSLTSPFAATGLILLLTSFVFLFLGRNRQSRQH